MADCEPSAVSKTEVAVCDRWIVCDWNEAWKLTHLRAYFLELFQEYQIGQQVTPSLSEAVFQRRQLCKRKAHREHVAGLSTSVEILTFALTKLQDRELREQFTAVFIETVCKQPQESAEHPGPAASAESPDHPGPAAASGSESPPSPSLESGRVRFRELVPAEGTIDLDSESDLDSPVDPQSNPLPPVAKRSRHGGNGDADR